VTIEIAESDETAKTRGINDATKRRALCIKAARFNAIPLYSFTGSASKLFLLIRNCLDWLNISPRNLPQSSKNERGGWDSEHTFLFSENVKH
jgi:hypothetical protein